MPTPEAGVAARSPAEQGVRASPAGTPWCTAGRTRRRPGTAMLNTSTAPNATIASPAGGCVARAPSRRRRGTPPASATGHGRSGRAISVSTSSDDDHGQQHPVAPHPRAAGRRPRVRPADRTTDRVTSSDSVRNRPGRRIGRKDEPPTRPIDRVESGRFADVAGCRATMVTSTAPVADRPTRRGGPPCHLPSTEWVGSPPAIRGA